LKCLFPKVASGGVVMFDEYLNSDLDWPGARQAIDEFFGEQIRQIEHDVTVNRYYLIKT
jgi:hypothetical protein